MDVAFTIPPGNVSAAVVITTAAVKASENPNPTHPILGGNMKAIVKVVGIHALIVGGAAAAATVVRDIIVLTIKK